MFYYFLSRFSKKLFVSGLITKTIPQILWMKLWRN